MLVRSVATVDNDHTEALLVKEAARSAGLRFLVSGRAGHAGPTDRRMTSSRRSVSFLEPPCMSSRDLAQQLFSPCASPSECPSAPATFMLTSRLHQMRSQTILQAIFYTTALFSTTTNAMSSSISPKLALGAGCYWGTEKYVVKDFQKKFPNSVAKASVGFMSPDPNAMENPSYRQVCSGSTGHVEVLYVELNEADKNFEELIKFFFQFHDPTTMNRQGNDVGTQYASVIFCDDDKQMEIATRVKNDLQKLVDEGKIQYAGKKVVTDIVKMNPYYPAHEEHQRYLEKNPLGYCNHYYRFKEWP